MFRKLFAAALLASACLFSSEALAQTGTPFGATAGSGLNFCAFKPDGTNLAGCEVHYVWNGSAWVLEPADTSGRPFSSVVAASGAFAAGAIADLIPCGSNTNRLTFVGNITSATTTTIFAAQGAGQFAYINDIDITNNGTTTVEVQIQNSAATVLWRGHITAGGGYSAHFQIPIAGNGQMTANTALTLVTPAGTTNIDANVQACKSSS